MRSWFCIFTIRGPALFICRNAYSSRIITSVWGCQRKPATAALAKSDLDQVLCANSVRRRTGPRKMGSDEWSAKVEKLYTRMRSRKVRLHEAPNRMQDRQYACEVEKGHRQMLRLNLIGRECVAEAMGAF